MTRHQRDVGCLSSSTCAEGAQIIVASLGSQDRHQKRGQKRRHKRGLTVYFYRVLFDDGKSLRFVGKTPDTHPHKYIYIHIL